MIKECLESLQITLRSLGLPIGKIDGICGPRTEFCTTFAMHELCKTGIIEEVLHSPLDNNLSKALVSLLQSYMQTYYGVGCRLNWWITLLHRQVGKPYNFGIEISATDPNPSAFDCSELIEWSLKQFDIDIPDGANNQFEFCVKNGRVIPKERLLDTKGAFGFIHGKRDHFVGKIHVGVADGVGNMIEARGKAYGVIVSPVDLSRWTHACVLPFLQEGVV